MLNKTLRRLLEVCSRLRVWLIEMLMTSATGGTRKSATKRFAVKYSIIFNFEPRETGEDIFQWSNWFLQQWLVEIPQERWRNTERGRNAGKVMAASLLVKYRSITRMLRRVFNGDRREYLHTVEHREPSCPLKMHCIIFRWSLPSPADRPFSISMRRDACTFASDDPRESHKARVVENKIAAVEIHLFEFSKHRGNYYFFYTLRELKIKK